MGTQVRKQANFGYQRNSTSPVLVCLATNIFGTTLSTRQGQSVRDAIETSDSLLPGLVCTLLQEYLNQRAEIISTSLMGILANIAADEKGRYLLIKSPEKLFQSTKRILETGTDKLLIRLLC